MGRGKHCTPEKRELIKQLVSKGKPYSEIRKLIGYSNKMVINAIKFNIKTETRGRKQILSPLMVKRLVRKCKN